MARAGAATLDDLRRRSVAEPAWFWDLVVADLDIAFSTPYVRVLDDSAGPAHCRWFVGGHVNVAHACVHRWRADIERAGDAALIADAEDGGVRHISFAELADSVDELAAALRADGVGPGDAIGVFMPMVPEAVVAMYAVAQVGAIYVPIFSGFAADAIVSRLTDAGVRVVLCAEATTRRGVWAPMRPALDAAVDRCPDVERVVILGGGGPASLRSPRDVEWQAYLAAGSAASRHVHDTEAEDVFMVAYTSGTTGRPKGAVHVHGGLTVKIVSEAAYQTDIGRGDRLLWVTDMGWIMGPWSAMGAHANGAAFVMPEGSPDYPDDRRLWTATARHGVTTLGVSPTLVRSLQARSAAPDQPMPTLRVLAATSEPWDPTSYSWLGQDVGGGALPIINISGGTEVGACFLSPYPVEPISACSLGGPSLGMDVAVFDGDGTSIVGAVGELVCRSPWPSMTRGVLGDPERYHDSYWSMYPGVWRHGDWTRVDDDGQWYLLGRSDEAINVAGKRLGPAEVESILQSHPAVAESAVVGVPDPVKGEAVWCFWVPVDSDADDVSPALSALVVERLGRPFKPGRVLRVGELPRTRTAKILRRAVRAAALGIDAGDLSTAENPDAVDTLREAVAADAGALRG